MATQNEITMKAAETAVSEGHILHVRASRLPGKRGAGKRFALPSVDLTVGPDARGGFLVVDYSSVKAGDEERHATAQEAVHAVRRLLGWDRIPALRGALVAVYGEPERSGSLGIEAARVADRGASMRGAYGHRPGITGPIFGPSGHGRA